MSSDKVVVDSMNVDEFEDDFNASNDNSNKKMNNNSSNTKNKDESIIDDEFEDDYNNNNNDNDFNDDNDEFNENDNDDGWNDNDNDQDNEITDEQEVKIKEDDLPSSPQQVKSLTISDLDKAIEKKVLQLKDELNLEEHKCLMLLRKYKWNVNKISEEYFTNSQIVLKDSGVCLSPRGNNDNKNNSSKNKKTVECQLCLEDVNANILFSMECGHNCVCKPCWVLYLCNGTQTKECVTQTCPAFKCSVIVPPNVWKLLLENTNNKEYVRYLRFCREDFIEHVHEYAFCPGKNCDLVYYCQSGGAREVECEKCKFKFCWNCKLESHFPASCHIAQKWISKNSNESENLQWILAKTKRCPKCGVHIEKNQGCNHMTCRKNVGGCGHEFCWLCKGDWKDHGSTTGGYYQCNIYEKQKNEGKLSDEEKASEDASTELQKYEFHWTRYDSHIKSSIHAVKQRETTQAKMSDLSQAFGWRLNEAQFLLDATNEVILCWHVLAWTYPIAYYFESSQNVELFKQHQSYLEKFCDGLQEKLDFDIQKLGDIKVRQEMIHYTRTAENYRKNLVDYIEGEVAI